jgi:hypothetical protein
MDASIDRAPRRLIRALRLVAVALCLCLAHAPAASAEATLGPGVALRVQLTLGPSAKILGGGTAARIPIRGLCTPGAEVLEAFVYLSQDGQSSEWGFIPLVCDGARHDALVEVQTIDFAFHPGLATASGYALVVDPRTGLTADDSPFRVITMVA